MAIQYEIRNAVTGAVLIDAWEITKKAQRAKCSEFDMAMRIMRQVRLYAKDIRPIVKRVE